MSLILKQTLAILYSSFLFSAVYAQDNKIDSSQMVTLRIDPAVAGGAAVSQIFEKIDFIK